MLIPSRDAREDIACTGIRTVEVTICINPERTARSSPTITELLKATRTANKKKKTLRCLLSLHVAYGYAMNVEALPKQPTTTTPSQPTPMHTSERPPQSFCPRQLRYLGRTASLAASAVGGQVPDVGIPHCRDARMQHSQSRQPALPGVTTVVAPRGVPASTNEVFPASPT